MLSLHRGWFIGFYAVGIALSIIYFCLIRHDESAGTANLLLVLTSHGLLVGAMALAKRGAHIRYIWRTFTIYQAVVGVIFVVCPSVMGMVGAFAAFVVIGYLHTRVVDLTPYLHVLDPKIKESKNDQYALWAMVCVVSLILFYWQCNFV